jgi:hypothetical protein
MNMPRTSIARWSACRDTLFIESTASFGTGENAVKVSTAESWTVGDGGRTLCIRQSSGGTRGGLESELIYERQKTD